jgi:hypothetical protein
MLSPGWLWVLIPGLRSGAGAPRFTLGTNPAPPFRGFTPALSSSQETTMEQRGAQTSDLCLRQNHSTGALPLYPGIVPFQHFSGSHG